MSARRSTSYAKEHTKCMIKTGRKRKLKLLLLLLAVSAAVLYIPAGILVSDGLQTEAIDAGQGTTSIKIAHLSDLHFPDTGVSTERIEEELRRFSPDLVVLTGDILDSAATKEDIDAFRPFLSSIGSYRYRFMALGNHDTLLKDLKYFKTVLREHGVVLLKDAAHEIEINGKKVGIAGISDKHSYGKESIDFDVLSPGIPVLLLAHRPEKWEEYLAATSDRVPLVTFSGHAHGGQIKLLGVGLYSPASGWFPKYYDGLYKKNGSYLVVSRGLGDSNFPYRVFNRYHMPCVTLNI